ncbi:PAS domain S-box-containing protein [Ectothiorhodosinus mongolicus]|uniref:PAS domain S-box-containing protein n=1 Tax=Ectothiorhodosinus mongolicus TaxID=233100 RepID=A0A1R3VM65_9GAMM|nr:helix-turn-helix domain-containing protein [Ectothiorhodosinus mongolicus]ULX57763.1 hypothetical protein CKX93_08950 [Ectothiorhodosinus mongolicus]SIT65626.1 PAS domain S-box-containing protein [Ectothiorhodosinus mongolicus]
MSNLEVHEARENQWLAKLTPLEFAHILPLMERVTLVHGDCLHRPGEPLEMVYFPISGIVSLSQIDDEGASMEMVMCGANSMIGHAIALGSDASAYQATVRNPGVAYGLSVRSFRRELRSNEGLFRATLAYVNQLLQEITSNAFCSRFHSLHARLGRWLLQTQALTNDAWIKNTQQEIADFLGVRREAVNIAMGQLEDDSLIVSRRGAFRIENLEALKHIACECLQATHPNKWGTTPFIHRGATPFGTPTGNAKTAYEFGPESVDEALILAQKNARQYKDLFDFAPVAYICVDRDMHILRCNLAGAILLHQKHSDMNNQDLIKYFVPEERENIAAYIRQILDGRRHAPLLAMIVANSREPRKLVTINAETDERGRQCRMVITPVRRRQFLY